MAKRSVLGKIVEKLTLPNHDYTPSTELFGQLDVNKIAKDLNLEDEGRKRGERNEPASNSIAWDEIEEKIIHCIESARLSAHNMAQNELHTYDERLASLDFDAQYARISQASHEAVTEFRQEVQQKSNDLHLPRRRLLEVENERWHFRKKNRLQDRTPQPENTTGAIQFLKILLLILIIIGETALNGSFLAKGNMLGLFGGIFEAFTFAIMNIGFSFMITMYGIKQIIHISFFRKLVGCLSVLVWAAVVVVINLALAHYREVSGVFIEEAGIQVIERVRDDPFGLVEMKSWVLFGLGVLFAFVTMVDVFSLHDRYPGYHKTWQKWQKLQTEYRSKYKQVFQKLVDIKNEYINDISKISTGLAQRLRAMSQIRQYRGRLLSLYSAHFDGLQSAADALFSIYHTANRETRTDQSPKRFDQRFSVTAIPLHGEDTNSAEENTTKKKVEQAKDLLTKLLNDIHSEFEDCRKQYMNLDAVINAYHAAIEESRATGNEDALYAFIGGVTPENRNPQSNRDRDRNPETLSEVKSIGVTP